MAICAVASTARVRPCWRFRGGALMHVDELQPPSMEEVLPELSRLAAAALDGLGDGIWIADKVGDLLYRNRTGERLENMFWTRDGLVGTMEDVVFNSRMLQRFSESESWTAEFNISGDDNEQRSVVLEMHRMATTGELVFHARDVSREWLREQALHDRHVDLEQAYAQLKSAQTQLVNSEKMASIGQLAAGVAHEINNPIGFVHSNLGTLQHYLSGLTTLLDAYEQALHTSGSDTGNPLARVEAIKRQIDYEFMRTDLPPLLAESREGIERVKKIVLDLRDFSHTGEADTTDWAFADIHRGLESTLNIVWSELKYKAEVHKEYAQLPLVECMLSQLNQVFLNLLVNAAHSIEDRGIITIVTSQDGNEVCISIADTGSGITPENLKHIFDPFFTTKPVGKGTGLGLSLSYGIVQKHHGRILVDSVVGEGTRFRVFLPVQQPT
jgi:two-component system, NtrC family, sensor kinase